MTDTDHLIWSNYHLDYEDWKDDLESEYPALSDEDRYLKMLEINNDYLDDERVNLNIQLSQPILIIADLGLWDGRHSGYKEIRSGNIKDCLFSNYDYATWYVDKNYAFNEKLETIQSSVDFDDVVVEGSLADWPEVLAIFAVKVAGSEDVDTTDVATLDPARIEKLKAVFWDMNSLSSYVKTINHPDINPDDDVDDSWTEKILHITIDHKTAADMTAIYNFSEKQNTLLEELLAERDTLLELIGEVTFIGAESAEVIKNLPDDISPERKAVIKAACSLVGKVNYFWGGKSLTIDWDSRWGTLQKVTADESPTTGTYRPYGMDCSGFVDWVFYNAGDGEYIISHGGGAAAQHSYCYAISWNEAMPGDLVFYPDDEHVGIVAGRDEDGNLLIIHCSSGYNNVVITGVNGFTSIGRPLFYN